MKKRNYVLITTLLIATLMFVLTACGPDKPASTTNTSKNEDYLGTYYIYKETYQPKSGDPTIHEVSNGTLQKTFFIIALNTDGNAVFTIDQNDLSGTYTVDGNNIRFTSGYYGTIDGDNLNLKLELADESYYYYEFKREVNNDNIENTLPDISIQGYQQDCTINPLTKTIIINETDTTSVEFNPNKIVLPSDASILIYKDEKYTQQVVGNLEIKDGINNFYLKIIYQGSYSNWILQITKYSKEENATIVKSIEPSNDIVKEYKTNDKFKDNQHFIVNYNNGSSILKLLDEKYVSGFSTSSEGTKTIIVSYKDKTFNYQIKVVDSKTEVVDALVVPDIEVNENVSNFGQLKIKENGVEKTIDITPDMVTGFDSSKIGYQEILVTYNGNTIKCGVMVNQTTIPQVKPITPTAPDNITLKLFKEVTAHAAASVSYPNKDLTDPNYKKIYDDYIAMDESLYSNFIQLISKMGIPNEDLDEDGALRNIVIKISTLAGIGVEKVSNSTGISAFVNIDFLCDCQSALKEFVAYFDKEKLATILCNVDYFYSLENAMLAYDYSMLEQYKNTKYYDQIVKQIELKRKSIVNYFEILNYSESVQVADILHKILLNTSKLPVKDVADYIEYIYNACMITDPTDLITKISFKDSIKTINFTGDLLEVVAKSISGYSQNIQQISTKIVKDTIYLYDKDMAEIYAYINKTCQNLDNINALIYMLKNVTVDDFTTIALDVDSLLKASLPNTPDENATQQEKDEYEKQLTKVQARYGTLIIDSAKIVNRLITTMPKLLRDMAFEVSEFICNAIAGRCPEFDCTFNVQAIMDAADKFGNMDPENMSDKKLQEIMEDFVSVSNSLITIPNQSNDSIIVNGNIPFIPVGATKEDLINELSTNHVSIIAGGHSTYLKFSDIISTNNYTISGFNSTVEGAHFITFTFSGLTDKIQYYVYDNTTKDKVANLNISYYPSDIPLQKTKTDAEILDELKYYIGVNYDIYQTGVFTHSELDTFELVDFDRNQAGTAAIVVHDKIIGDIYIPIVYSLY